MHYKYVRYNQPVTLFLYLKDTSTYAGGEPRTGRSPYFYYKVDSNSVTNSDVTVAEVSSSYLPGVYSVTAGSSSGNYPLTNGYNIVGNLYDSAGYRSDPISLFTDATPPKAALPTGIETKIDNIDNFVDTEVASIKTTVEGNSTKLDTIDNFLDTEVAAILEDTGTTLPATLSTISGKVDTVDGVVDSILVDTAALSEPVDCNVTQISGSSTAADQLEKGALTVVTCQVDSSVTPTTETFKSDTGGLSSVDKFYVGRTAIFTSGGLQNQARQILDYTGATKVFTVEPMTTAPANDDYFIIV